MSCNPARWLETAAHRCPAAPALSGEAGRLTFAELHRLTDGVAARLSLRHASGAVVPLRLPTRWWTALYLHGVMRLGGIPFPLAPGLSGHETAALLRQAGTAPTAVEDGVCPLDPPSATRVTARPRSPDQVQLIVATSGSGGMPKGVMLSGANLCAAVEASSQRIPLGPGDRWLDCLPLQHIGGLSILYRCLAAGADAVLHEHFDAERIWRSLHGDGITHLSLVPAMLARLLEVAGDTPPPATLRHLLVGGAMLAPALAERAAAWPLCVTYGMTETASQLATDCANGAGCGQGQVGRPLPGFDVGIRRGRVAVRGPAVMAGYVNPAMRPGDGLRDGWFVTPDLGVLDAGGRLRILGRADRILVSGGENVDPARVERCLEACTGVVQAGVTAVTDPVWGDRLVAFIVGPASTDAVGRWCRERLPASHRPRCIVSVPHLPRGALGKLRRTRLREWAEAHVSGVSGDG